MTVKITRYDCMPFGTIIECDRCCLTCKRNHSESYTEIKEISIQEFIDMLNRERDIKLEVICLV